MTIAALLAAMAVEAQPAPDAAEAALDLSRRCLAVMTGEAEPPATGSRRIPVGDDLYASVRITPEGCSIEIDGWRDDSGAFATRVRDGLSAEGGDWRVLRWRERLVNESGPSRWTSLVLPDIAPDRAYRVLIIEPEPGAPQRLGVTFGIDP